MIWCIIDELVNAISNIFGCAVLIGMLYCAYLDAVEYNAEHGCIVTSIVYISVFLIILCTYIALKIC